VIYKGLHTPGLEEPVGHTHLDAPREESGEMTAAQFMSTSRALLNTEFLLF
jgi:hypothetical protein